MLIARPDGLPRPGPRQGRPRGNPFTFQQPTDGSSEGGRPRLAWKSRALKDPLTAISIFVFFCGHGGQSPFHETNGTEQPFFNAPHSKIRQKLSLEPNGSPRSLFPS